MLNLNDIDHLISKAASASLKRAAFRRAFSAPTTDSEGHEALPVTIVLSSNKTTEINGEKTLATIVRIQRDLRKSGEERFPIVDFVTEDELNQNADPEF